MRGNNLRTYSLCAQLTLLPPYMPKVSTNVWCGRRGWGSDYMLFIRRVCVNFTSTYAAEMYIYNIPGAENTICNNRTMLPLPVQKKTLIPNEWGDDDIHSGKHVRREQPANNRMQQERKSDEERDARNERCARAQ